LRKIVLKRFFLLALIGPIRFVEQFLSFSARFETNKVPKNTKKKGRYPSYLFAEIKGDSPNLYILLNRLIPFTPPPKKNPLRLLGLTLDKFIIIPDLSLPYFVMPANFKAKYS
jgi:hypothetical protein